jgi:hypothetical protein
MELEYSLHQGDNQIDYSIIPYSDLRSGEAEIDQLLLKNKQEIDELTKQLEGLRIDADKWDYSISAISGVLAGIVDIVFVGELSFKNLKECHEIGSEKVNEMVKKAAKHNGFKEDPNLSSEENLKEAIKKLQNSHLASDQNNIKNAFGGGKQHHFRDFTHHPTLIGWLFSMFMQFSEGYVVGANAGGMLVIEKVEDPSLIGKDPFQKVLFGTVHWLLHMFSDMAGTDQTAGAGTGLPGPILSLAKEIDAVRVRLFNGNAQTGNDADELTKHLSKLFNGTFLAEHDADGKIIKGTELRFDYRTEIGMLENVKEASKMFIPVLINECIVRSFFFIKRFVIAVRESSVKSLSDLKKLEWKKIIPFNNATLTRMLTISVATMEVIDITDAAIRGAIEAEKAGAVGAEVGAVGGPYGAAAGAATSGTVAFWKTFALRINYIGIGRVVICLGSELSFEYKRQKVLSERIAAYDEALNLMNAKVLFREADMWISAQKAGESIEEAYQLIGITEEVFSESYSEIDDNLSKIAGHIDAANEKNPGLKDDMLNTLKWGI